MDEYIKREDVLKAIEALPNVCGCSAIDRTDAEVVIMDCPTADVAPKSEVVEVFANRLKERLYTIPTVYNSHFSRMVDNIAKDMKGERDV